METTRIRAFRVSTELDAKLTKKAREGGYMSPSEYIRDIVRDAVEDKEEARTA